MLLLDGAVDRCMAENLAQCRHCGKFAGVAVATDESPPSQPQFRGFRFQITVFYIGLYVDSRHWNSCEDPPIISKNLLADIMHCPGKKGVDASRVIDKQLGRIGCTCFDVCSVTGDGGGENEGHQGVHAYFENLNTRYVRRKCLAHSAYISWSCSSWRGGLGEGSGGGAEGQSLRPGADAPGTPPWAVEGQSWTCTFCTAGNLLAWTWCWKCRRRPGDGVPDPCDGVPMSLVASDSDG